MAVGGALRREWLETNGLGGFACSTLAGLNTRRYHGLLTVATRPPVGRVVLLSKLEETVVIGGQRFELSTNRYPGVLHPRGFEHLAAFEADPFPTFTWDLGQVRVKKSVCLIHGEETLVVQYQITPDAALEVRPLIAFRDYHSLTHANGTLNPLVERGSGLLSLKPYADLPALHVAHDADSAGTDGVWYYHFEYDEERERGLDFREDLFNPCVLRYEARRDVSLVVSTNLHSVSDAPALLGRELRRRRAPRWFIGRLIRASDAFIVKRGAHSTILAGYPWFTDWGRDAMISLPGLTLLGGRPEVAKEVLTTFAEAMGGGMLPNRFPDAGETPEYNTVDATLWFVEAVRAYLAATGDMETVRALYPKIREFVVSHVEGTRYGIGVDEDGLLRCGAEGVQLTWMDAKVGDWVVTPRHGKPVEIQALWYNALNIAADLASRLGDEPARRQAANLAGRARASFLPLFWNAGEDCLCDCITAGARDTSIRPNQIFAVSLHYPILEGDHARQVVETVRRHLLTPMGLRTLAPSDAAYRGRYGGGIHERDGAYHQGTVWPWLLGPFISAWLRVHNRSADALRQAASWLDPLEAHLDDACVGHLSEIADGDPPHAPRGCFAQAWSVAEILRAAVEVQRAPSSTINS